MARVESVPHYCRRVPMNWRRAREIRRVACAPCLLFPPKVLTCSSSSSMGKDAKTSKYTAPLVAYLPDESLAESGRYRYLDWKQEVEQVFSVALNDSDPLLANWLRTTCANAAEGSLAPPVRILRSTVIRAC